MTSRFFQVSSGEESSDDENPELGNTAVTRFDNFSDSDSDGDVKRVVKSAKDKRFEELQGLTEKIATLKKINDWGLIATTFDQMFKVYEKAKLHMGADAAQAPRFFVKCYAELDAFNKQMLEQKKGGHRDAEQDKQQGTDGHEAKTPQDDGHVQARGGDCGVQ